MGELGRQERRRLVDEDKREVKYIIHAEDTHIEWYLQDGEDSNNLARACSRCLAVISTTKTRIASGSNRDYSPTVQIMRSNEWEYGSKFLLEPSPVAMTADHKNEIAKVRANTYTE